MINPIQVLNRMRADSTHIMWVVVQFAIVRSALAIKFFLAAKLLGPEMIGLVGIALLCLATVESLSETGLSHAIVQRRDGITREEAGAVWTLQMARGGLLSLLLFSLAMPLSGFFDVAESAELIGIVAVAPLLRNAFNPGVFLIQRERNFKRFFFYEAGAACIDLFVTLALIHIGRGAEALLLGALAGDLVKLAQTWTRFRLPLAPNFNWKRLDPLMSFGKWIWGTSFLTFLLNQLDKLLVAKLLGATQLGLYQVASRIAQLALADGATALGQYLFPTFSQKFRLSRVNASVFFRRVFRLVALGVLAIALTLGISADFVLGKLLGPEWLPAREVLRILSFSMAMGALIAVLVSYCRAVGKPDLVTKATFGQLLVLAPSSLLLTAYFGASGMAAATALAGTFPVVFMLRKISSINRNIHIS